MTEVTPEGQSWLVTYGLRNLTHRDSHEAPAPLVPGRDYDVKLPLFAIGHRFSRGNRIRVAISESLWPLAWPTPRIATLTLTLGEASSLTLPERQPEATPSRFTIPEIRTPPAADAARPTAVTAPVTPGQYSIRNDAELTTHTIEAVGTEVSRGSWETSDLREGAPESCRWTHRVHRGWRRGDWDCAVEAEYELRATESKFLLSERLTARKGGEVIFERRVDHAVPRNLV